LTDFEPETPPLTRLLNASWPLFRAFRVDVRVSWTIVIWPLLIALPMFKWLPAGEALGWGAAWTVANFTTVWFHEMGHITMGRRCGIETERMTLRALGGLAHLQAPAQTPRDDALIALAGPVTHLLWMAVLFPAVWLLRDAHGDELWFWMLSGFAQYQVVMLVFNLLPVYPLDGGRAARSLLALRIDATKASYHIATLGFVGNGIFVLLGVLSLFGIADSRSWGAYGFLIAWLGIEGIQACRQLRLEAKYGGVYADRDPFQQTLVASQAAMREIDRDEQRERDERRAARERREKLQETADRLLDRINEVGGIEKLSAKERAELERASRALAEEE
jgi:Zn-dependent protease